MITAVDTNVLVDIFQDDERFVHQSRERLANARIRGDLVVCQVVFAELVHGFEDKASLDDTLDQLGISISSIDNAIAYEAGRRWGRYRRAGGPRSRILADFMIGAHALISADSLLTRDDGFYQTYFPELNSPLDTN